MEGGFFFRWLGEASVRISSLRGRLAVLRYIFVMTVAGLGTSYTGLTPLGGMEA